MGWPYHFVSLTDEQQIDRRHALDWYAVVGQLSVLTPLFLCQCFFFARWIIRRWRKAAQHQPPSSPIVKHAKLGRFARFEAQLRKIQWWAGGEIRLLGGRLGTKGEVVGAVVWFCWLVVLCFMQTGDDYMHLTKRFGIVAASQLPLHYLLAIKSPYSPLQLLTRTSHETINTLHQLLGRIIICLLTVHAILYLNFYVLSSLLLAKIQQFYVICGIIGILSFVTVGTTALAPVRKWNYRVFYVIHVSLATALLPILYFHVSHIRPYLYQTAAIYAVNAVLRHITTKKMAGTLTLIPGTNLVEVKIANTTGSEKRHQPGKWQAGQHAYVSLPGYRFLTTFRSNPFTVASLPSIDGEIKFVARVLDGNTRKLAQYATKDGNANIMRNISVEGPYGVASHGEDLLRYDRVLLIAGGIGSTFILPLYRQLLADLSPSRRSYRRQKVSFVWIARSKADVMWALPQGDVEREGFVERLKVCITGQEDLGDESAPSSAFAVGEDENETNNTALGETDEGIELEEQKQLLAESNSASQGASNETLAISAGRPETSRLVAQAFTHSTTERVAVLVCGPDSLNASVRNEVGKWVMKGRDVWFWNESFSL
ncbi:Hypothetical protein R9X50_00122200 [Acrodontium crateriforme]|uniref:ferric-chelate reductase (NADPH) n=1 Tax=Acrodontium crateriforme TaxID=150365 RepID=A0AAQ3M1N2_9PEZI|nr:Hypothetical protein R9X50_00122200 [Acrodontium crateriforme]